MTSGMVVGKESREKLNVEDEGFKNRILDACLGSYPDVDLLGSGRLYGVEMPSCVSSTVKNCLGEHRGNFHIPLVEFLVGGSVMSLYCLSKKHGRPKPKELLKYFASGGLTSLAHFCIDLFSGGETPVWFGYKLNVHPYVGKDYNLGLLYHGGILAGSLICIYRKEISKFLSSLYGRNNK